MSRMIVCRGCGDDWQLHREDKARGITARKLYLSTDLPQGHGFTVNGVFQPLTEVLCDICSNPVTGEVAVAITIVPPDRLIGDWEQEYGTVLPPETVALADKLKGKT